MNAQNIDAALQLLVDSGITIEHDAGSIVAKPSELVTTEIAEVIRHHKPALVRLLRLTDGLWVDEATEAYMAPFLILPAEPISPEAAKLVASGIDPEAIPIPSTCPHCAGPLTPVRTFDHYENFECIPCDQCFGCRKVVAP